MPSRNLTFPSIIQLLSTIVEGRCYCTGFRCFSHHYMKALVYSTLHTQRHHSRTMLEHREHRHFPGYTIFSLTEQQQERFRISRITRQNPYSVPSTTSIHLDNLGLLRALLRFCSLLRAYSAHYPFPCTWSQWRSTYVLLPARTFPASANEFNGTVHNGYCILFSRFSFKLFLRTVIKI